VVAPVEIAVTFVGAPIYVFIDVAAAYVVFVGVVAETVNVYAVFAVSSVTV
jgi:hypothetical protein